MPTTKMPNAKVCPYPAGGWTVGIPSVGTVLIYTGWYRLKRHAEAALKRLNPDPKARLRRPGEQLLMEHNELPND